MELYAKLVSYLGGCMKKKLVILCLVGLAGCASYNSGYDALGAALGMDIKSNEELYAQECYRSGYAGSNHGNYGYLNDDEYFKSVTNDSTNDRFLDKYKKYKDTGKLPISHYSKLIPEEECRAAQVRGLEDRYESLEAYVLEKEIRNEKVRQEATAEQRLVTKQKKKERQLYADTDASKISTASTLLADMTSCIVIFDNLGQKNKASAMFKTVQLTHDRAVAKYGREVEILFEQKIKDSNPNISRCESLFYLTN